MSTMFMNNLMNIHGGWCCFSGLIRWLRKEKDERDHREWESVEGRERKVLQMKGFISLVVKDFDGSRRVVIWEIDLAILIGPHDFTITFQVMNSNPTYNCLLRRSWTHVDATVISTLHQKIKFIISNKLIIVFGEEDMLVSHLSSFRYIEADGESLETSS